MFRWIVLAVFVVNIGISGYFRRKARQSGDVIGRGEEGGGLVALRLLFTLPLLVSIVAYILNPSWMAWSSVAVPEGVRWAGAVLGVAVVPMTYWVLRTIGRNISETVLTKASHQLVTEGPYRWVRHPLYSVGAAMLIAISLLTANWFIGAMTGIVVVMILLVVIPREEANLIETFGEAYRTYTKRTGRLLPRLRGDAS